MNSRIAYFIHFCLLFCAFYTAQAQEFIRVDYSGRVGSYFKDVAVLANGNYVCTGVKIDATLPVGEMLTIIYSPSGQPLYKVNSLGFNYEGNAVAATFDGGFVVVGKRNPSTGINVDDFMFNRYNSTGDSIWGKVCTSPSGIPRTAYDVKQLPDSGFVIVGNLIHNTTSLRSQYYVLRTDAQGNKLWEHQGGTVNAETAKNVLLTQDGGFLVTGVSDTANFFIEKGFALKLDANGNQQWLRMMNDFTPSAQVHAAQIPSGDYLVVREASNGFRGFYWLNSQGTILSNTSYSDTANGSSSIQNIIVNADSTYSIVGGAIKNGKFSIYLAKLNSLLSPIWAKTYGNIVPSSTFHGFSVIQTADKGFAIAGRWADYKAVLIKTDSLGNVKLTSISGNLIADQNENCTFDSSEVLVARKMVTVATANDVFYGYSDQQGKYVVEVYDTGQAEVSWPNNDSYWVKPACQPTANVVTVLQYDTTIVDLYSKISTFCPRLSISIHNNRLIRCFGNNPYFFTYCNNGTATANNAYIEVEFDQYLTIDSSSLAFTPPTTGNTYRFDVGNLDMGFCGSFVVWTTVDCDSTVLGQAHCVEAYIYPDTICRPNNPVWDMSYLVLESACIEGDSVKFTLTNQGTGNMAAPQTYTVVEDTTIVQQVPFQLNSGQSLTVTLAGNGSTYTMIVPQSIGHPGSSAPLRVLEGCGKDDQGDFEIGYFMQFPQDDQNEFVDIHCAPNRGSYDPNEKLAEPLGLGADGYINATQPLAYTINFQNTGTDTAFTVVLRDTLPTQIDITTLQLTGASHNYTFRILGSNVLEWTFLHIMLPDSNVNEPLSHGFVSFNINQIAGNAPGTQIKNRAGIYFDFNQPVITNYTVNTVVEDYKTELATSVSIQEVSGKAAAVKLYPNPNTGQFYIELLQPFEGELSLTIYDLAGKQVSLHRFTGNGPYLVDVKSLETGMYFYTLTQGAESISNGKLVIEQH